MRPKTSVRAGDEERLDLDRIEEATSTTGDVVGGQLSVGDEPGKRPVTQVRVALEHLIAGEQRGRIAAGPATQAGQRDVIGRQDASPLPQTGNHKRSCRPGPPRPTPALSAIPLARLPQPVSQSLGLLCGRLARTDTNGHELAESPSAESDRFRLVVASAWTIVNRARPCVAGDGSFRRRRPRLRASVMPRRLATGARSPG